MEHINKSLKFRVECKNAETKLLEMCNIEITNRTDMFDDDKDIKDILLNEEKSQDILINTFDTKREEESTDDEKPLTDLFDNEIEIMNSNLEKKDSDKDYKVEKVTITENIILDTSMFKHLKNDKEKSLINSDKCHSTNNSTLNELKIESTEELTNKGKKKVTCGICKKNLSVRSVDAHMSKRHPGADVRKIKCEFCDKYVLKMKMDRHLKMIHGKDNSICGVSRYQLPFIFETNNL